MSSYLNGLLLCFSTIVAIGAQNIFVLQQGLAKNHILAVATICFLCDMTLFGFGVFAMSQMTQNRTLTLLLGFGGIAFLLFYGIFSFISSFKGARSAKTHAAKTEKLSTTIFKTLAITLLNPHVYLDTVVIIGSLAASIANDEKFYFFLGLSSGSLIWFYSLGFGASVASKFFENPKIWQIIDFLVGVLMFYMVYLLIIFLKNV